MGRRNSPIMSGDQKCLVASGHKVKMFNNTNTFFSKLWDLIKYIFNPVNLINFAIKFIHKSVLMQQSVQVYNQPL